jgi:hypothetical protein
MQVLIHKTYLARIEPDLRRSAISLGDSVQLVQEEHDEVAAFILVPSRLPFGMGKDKNVLVGYLGNKAKTLIMPAIHKGSQLRVRIVEIQLGHLNADGMDRVSISVWGDPADIMLPAVPAKIFSQTRIHDGPPKVKNRLIKKSAPLLRG